MNILSELSFSEFEKTSKYAWSERLKEELHQAGKELKLQTGSDPEPFYTREDMDVKTSFAHQQFQTIKPWLLDEQVVFNSDVLTKLEKAVQVGTDGVSIIIKHNLSSDQVLALLTASKSLKFLNFYFDAEREIPDLLFDGHCGVLRIITEKPWPSDYTLEKQHSLLKRNFTNYRFLSISSAQHSNEDTATELSKTLALAIELINYFTERGIALHHALKNIEFSFTIGKSFLPEVAKLRAMRFLWNRVLEAYGVDASELNTPIHCSVYPDAVASPENAIRLTIEAMAAVFGGCNSLTIIPFSNENADFSERISRNIALLLKEESYLDKVIDPLGGAYYIEKTTSLLAEKAWGILRYIENKGGYLKNI